MAADDNKRPATGSHLAARLSARLHRGEGSTNALLDSLTRDGLVTLQSGTVRTGTRRITVVWVEITDIGRAVVAA
jgi:hypothetical protein